MKALKQFVTKYPQTCTNCGADLPADGVVFAENEDFARNGRGYCAACADAVNNPKSAKSESKSATDEKPADEKAGKSKK